MTMLDEVRDDRRLVTFLYLLARDEVPFGSVERLLDAAERITTADTLFTVGELGRWAQRAAERVAAARAFSIDVAHLIRQREWSARTFGPGARTRGVVDHLRKELDEVLAAPADPSEWADLVILAFDGALRAGIEPQVILDAVAAKQARNEARTWPDWRTADPDRAIEHVRTIEDDDPPTAGVRVPAPTPDAPPSTSASADYVTAISA